MHLKMVLLKTIGDYAEWRRNKMTCELLTTVLVVVLYSIVLVGAIIVGGWAVSIWHRLMK